MKRYIITESQLEKIVDNRKGEILDEGLKDVVLGLLLATTSLGNVFAQTGNNDNVLKKVQSTEVQQKAAKLLVQQGDMSYEEALKFVQDNANNYKDEFKKKFGSLKKVVKVGSEKEYQRFLYKLKDGYSITKIEADTVAKKLGDIPQVEDKLISVNAIFSSDKSFETGGYQLNSEVEGNIGGLLDSLKQQNHIIMGVEVESSTDTEPISMGNDKLATLRAKSIANLLVGKGVDSSIIDITTKPEQGPNVYSNTMGDEERAEARTQTAKYRYVRINLVLTKLVEAPPQDKDIDDSTDVLVYSIEISKPIKDGSKSMKQGKIAKGSCKKLKCPNPFKSFDTPEGSILGN